MSDSNSSPPGTTVVPSVTQALVNKQGIITQTWWSFFYSLYQRTGSATQQSAGGTNAQITALQDELSSQASQIETLQEEVSALEKSANSGLSFYNGPALVGSGASLVASGELEFSLTEGKVVISDGASPGQPIVAVPLSGSPLSFVAPSNGALSLSGGQVTLVQLVRGNQTIQLFP